MTTTTKATNDVTIYRPIDGGAQEVRIGSGQLTTDHPRSCYGHPVLVIDGKPYGPGDSLPDGTPIKALRIEARQAHRPAVDVLDAVTGEAEYRSDLELAWERLTRTL